MLPPSSGRIGTRLNSPITGPAQKIAHVAGSPSSDDGVVTSAPMAKRMATLVTIWIPGPANEIPMCSSREMGRVGT